MRKLRRNLDLLVIALFMTTAGLGAPLFLWGVTQFGTNQIKDAAITNAKMATGISAEKVGADTSVSNTEYGFLNGVTGPIQDQINNISGGGGGGIGNSGSTPGYLVEWTDTDTVGNATNTDTEVADAVAKAHAGSHSGTAGKIPMFTGTNTLGDSGQTDTQTRTKHLRLMLIDPSTLTDTTLCLVPALASAITVIQENITCDTSGANIAGDLKWADAFIGLASAAVIETFDTSSGVRVDSSIATPAVASGKCLYLQFDSQPPAGIKMISIDITYTVN